MPMGDNPNSRANLRLWQPGQSGNPFGRTRGKKLRSTAISKFLKLRVKFQNTDDEGNRLFEELAEEFALTTEERLAFALVTEALNGNVGAYREIMDTVYGKIPDKQEITGANGGPIETRQAVDEKLMKLTPDELAQLERLRLKMDGMNPDDAA